MENAQYRIEYTEQAKEDLQKLSPEIIRIIKKMIERKLTIAPHELGKPLRHKLAGFYRLAVGDYRVIYAVEDSLVLVLVVKVGHRKDIY